VFAENLTLSPTYHWEKTTVILQNFHFASCNCQQINYENHFINNRHTTHLLTGIRKFNVNKNNQRFITYLLTMAKWHHNDTAIK